MFVLRSTYTEARSQIEVLTSVAQAAEASATKARKERDAALAGQEVWRREAQRLMDELAEVQAELRATDSWIVRPTTLADVGPDDTPPGGITLPPLPDLLPADLIAAARAAGAQAVSSPPPLPDADERARLDGYQAASDGLVAGEQPLGHTCLIFGEENCARCWEQKGGHG